MTRTWVPVFRTGTHTDMSGHTRTWTGEDLDKIISSYDPQTHEAPVVIGHPKENAPAYGWVQALKRTGDVLYAGLKDLDPAFVQIVREGRYRKRSISLYPDLTLRHVGFLGAVPPAVKGLPDVKFSIGETAAHTIEIDKEISHMSFMQKLKDLMRSEGVDMEDEQTKAKTFSEQEVAGIVSMAVQKAKEEIVKAQEAKEQSFKEACAVQQEELKSKEDAIARKETDLRRAETASFCDGLVKEGKLTPAMLNHGMGLASFLSTLDISTVHEFGEGDAKKSQTPRQFMETFLQSLPKAVHYGEFATRDKDVSPVGDHGKALEKLVEQKMATDTGLSYTEAMNAVSLEHPQLVSEFIHSLQ